MIKKGFLAIVLVLALAGMAFAGPYVGGQFGMNIPQNTDTNVTVGGTSGTLNGVAADTGWMAGAIVGYDFDEEMFPAWSRYFGVAMDFNYNTLNFPAQTVSTSFGPSVGIPQFDGNQMALAFLLKAKYPLMVTSDFPKGRVQPYVMAGPALVFTTVDFANVSTAVGRQTSTDVGVVAEAGVAYFINPQFSVSGAYRYRYCSPSFNVNVVPAGRVNFDSNNHTVLVRFAYHF